MQREPKSATVIDRICSEPTLRRQFLWLRAQEKGDIETVQGFEALDQALSSRMAALAAEFEARGNHLDTPDERRRGFGRMQDELFEQYAETLERRHAVSHGSPFADRFSPSTGCKRTRYRLALLRPSLVDAAVGDVQL